MKLHRILAGLAVGLALGTAQAHSFQLGQITIGHPYARATAPGQPIGGAYLTLENKGADDRLMSASAAVSASVELHSMAMEGDVMRMRQVNAVDVPSGKK